MLDIKEINPNDIDEFGGVYTKDGYEFLSNEEQMALRQAYELQERAKRNLISGVSQSTEKSVPSKSNNNTKLTLQKSNTVKCFKSFNDVRNVVKQGKVFFIAGSVVFVSVFAQAFIMKEPEIDNISAIETSIDDIKLSKNALESPKVDSIIYNQLVADENFKERANFNDISLERNLINHYCEIYGVDYDIVFRKIRELTDNFTSSDYLSGTIPGIICKSEQVQCDSKEELLLLAVRIIKQSPEDFDLTEENIKVPVKQVFLGVENATCDDVIVDEYHEKIDYYAKMFNLDRCLMHGIVQCETGFDSDRFIRDHNPAGLCMEGEFRIFDSDEEGLIELCTELVKYRKMGATTIAEIGKIHCPGEDYDDWVNLVTECTENALENQEQMFPIESNEYKIGARRNV